MIFVSAGHCNKQGPNYDPGASGVNGRLEANETIKVRDRVITILTQKGYKYIKDSDGESLREYLHRIESGTGSVVVEFHFDAFNGLGTGCTALVGEDADENDKAFAKEMALATARILGIGNRGHAAGFITEAESHRGRLGLMREMGTVCLMEVCFIDHADDMAKFDANFEALCQSYANIIAKYEDLIK